MTTSLRRPSLLILLALLALSVAGLAASTGGAAEPSAGASAAKGVSIVNFAFRPGTLKVKRGARVTFSNTATTTHTATSAGFDTKRIAPGKSKTVQLDRRGTIAYHCKIHPFMKGKIVVE
ncbi:MAG TPA: cupredoxin domain-containing protein [Solirubrobacterales bacterium]|nr:cupredoxin domain-containing protein [Solirubrobacterales bacterium]